MRSERRRIWIGLLFAVVVPLLAFVSGGCACNTYTVCPSGCNYTSIQAAVDAASDGDTIIVRDGAYTENVNVNKRLTIRSENGSANCVVQALDPDYHVFEVTVDYVNISGFSVKNVTGSWKAGIYLKNISYCNISDNVALNNEIGIYSESGNNNTVTDNYVQSHSWYGIYLIGSRDNTIASNSISKNKFGIYLGSSNKNNITGNLVEKNIEASIYTSGGSYNEISKNYVQSNTYNGIYLGDSHSIVTGNYVKYNTKGIFIASLNCTVAGNYIQNNSWGIRIGGDYNLIYDNYVTNGLNVVTSGLYMNNIWNISKTSGTNIIGGSWIGGNYWSDYSGEDTNGDGLGDTLLPYNSSGGIQNGGDWLPLVEAGEKPYSNVDVGVTSNITLADPEDITAYLPPEYNGMDVSDAVVLNVDVADDTPGNTADDAYTDITIAVGEMDIETCKVFKSGMGFLPEVPDVTALPTVDGDPVFSRDLGNNTITMRLYVGDPLLAVLPPAEPSVFDTGEGSYPSISGTFTGTITPSRDLTVSTLYTYYCEGTGGHTTSINLYENETLLASGVWDGYQGDWHNITLSSEVTLLQDHEYRYVIETGSYPQIIHAESKDVTGGTITCTEFIDINGKRHEGWIPAIRLS